MTVQPFSDEQSRVIVNLEQAYQVWMDSLRVLNDLPYNQEPGGRATLRSFRGVVRHGCAHCLEAALFAATVLEQHGNAERSMPITCRTMTRRL